MWVDRVTDYTDPKELLTPVKSIRAKCLVPYGCTSNAPTSLTRRVASARGPPELGVYD
jgi:hypothetical protein